MNVKGRNENNAKTAESESSLFLFVFGTLVLPIEEELYDFFFFKLQAIWICTFSISSQ